MLTHEFMRNALIAGTAIAAACGVVGYFLVMRAQVFAGDALSHVAFTGALAAAALGLDVRVGLFVATVAVATGMGAAGERARADDAAIGTVFAWILGLGVLFLALFTSHRSATNGAAAVRVLFGSIFGLSAFDTALAGAVALAAIAATLVLVRPLLFSSVDPELAVANGVPVRIVGLAFLAVAGVVAAEATQAVGALLLLGLVAAPAAAAQRLVANPYAALGVSSALAVAAVWLGLVVAYVEPSVPPSTAIVSVAAGMLLLSSLRR